MINCVVQKRGDEIRNIFQWQNTQGVYKAMKSIERYCKNRNGIPIGFFGRDIQIGEIITWYIVPNENEIYSDKIVMQYEVK